MKRIIRLTESKLNRIIKESVKRVLRESQRPRRKRINEVSDSTLFNAHAKAVNQSGGYFPVNFKTPEEKKRYRQKQVFGNELNKRINNKYFDEDGYEKEEIDNMTDDELRQTDLYKYLFNELKNWDFAEDPSNIMDSGWGHNEIYGGLKDITGLNLPPRLTFLAIEDFQKYYGYDEYDADEYEEDDEDEDDDY